jgi:hypothetical protein
MKLSARRKYDYRDLEKIEAKHNSYASDMLFGEIAANWAIRSLKERALTRHLRAFGRQRGNIGRNWLRREPRDSQSFGLLGLSVEAVGRVKTRRDCTPKHAVDGSAAGRSGRSLHEI